MQDLGINPVDIVVLVIVVLSGALAFVRGFVKEVLAVVGWVGAAIATLQLFPYVRPITRQYIQTEMLADGLAGLGIFLITLLLFSILSHSIAKGVRNSAISAVDRSLGFLFGLARGAVVVCLAYLLVVSVLAPKDQPAWLRNARVMPLLEWGTSRIILLVPNEYRPNVDLGANAADIQARPPTALPPARMPAPQPAPGAAPAQPQAPALNPLPTAPTDKAGQTGYKTEDRRELEQILRGQTQ